MVGLIIGLSILAALFITVGCLMLKSSAKREEAHDKIMEKHNAELEKEISNENGISKVAQKSKETKEEQKNDKNEELSMWII